ncbi:MAG TPA: DUF4384 domain-containing protein [Firmicutes bacterium]|nr:DUF4384 domain-containing protein [Bacillota bacterium]
MANQRIAPFRRTAPWAWKFGIGLALVALSLVLAGAFAQTSWAAEEESSGAKVQPMTIIIQPPPAGPFNVRIWVDRPVYYPGENIQIHFSTSRDAYIYILDLDTQGNQRLLLPNQYETDNFFRAGTYTVPRQNYSFAVEGPAGTEYLQIIAASKPIRVLEDLRMYFSATINIPLFGGQLQATLGGPFPLISDPRDLRTRIEDSLRADKSIQWTTAYTSFQVGTPGVVIPPPPPPNQPPVARADADPTRVEVNQNVSFDASRSYDPDGSIVYYGWDFNNDGRIDATGMRANWRYAQAGTYVVRLQVQDNLGFTSVDTVTVQVVAPTPLTQVMIRSNPSGADVYLDGTYMGRTPVRFSTTRAWHELRVKRFTDEWRTQINLEGLDSIDIEIDFD